MRLGILLTTLGLAALALCALIFISPRPVTPATAQVAEPLTGAGDQPPLAPPPEEAAASPATLPRIQPLSTPTAKKESSQTEGADASARAELHETQVEARIAELRDLSRKKDMPSLEVLLSEVKNSDQEIRQAALDAIGQTGNRAAIPRLLELAAQTENAKEKQAIVDAVEFMKLPTLTEVLRKTNQ
jgi:hypothetical protein